MIGNTLSVLFGLAVVVLVLSDIFQSVIVPRAVGRRFRISFYVWRAIWQRWPSISWRLHPRNEDAREESLAVFAPFTLVLLLIVWASCMIVGFGFVFWGLRAGISPPLHSLGDALYFSGTTMLTVGFGDFVGRTPVPRFFSVIAAISGLSVFSIVTAYLFLLFASFQTREAFVVMVGARAGAPPSGVNLLAIAAYSETRDDLPRVMIDAQRWAAQVMESHLAYPVLAFFRSSHDYESWVGTLGTLLDAASLMMTTIQGAHNGQARIFYNIGRHATHDLARYFHVGAGVEAPGIERREFELACDRLQHAGYELHDRDEAWSRFAALRSTYANHLNAMAAFFEIPPLQWIGDRGMLPSKPHAASADGLSSI
jgi:hypothetical protein